jgi:hypothetical protein
MKKERLIIIAVFFLFSCNDNNEHHGEPNAPLVYESLTADNDTLISGETTKVTAVASGYDLIYYWSSTAGDILGSGAQVTYATSPCQTGTNQVTYRVKDGHDESQTKTIDIVVQ